MRFTFEYTIVYKILDEYNHIIRYGETLEREFYERMARHEALAKKHNRKITWEIVAKFCQKRLAKQKEKILIRAYIKRYGFMPGNHPHDKHPLRNKIIR